MRFASTILLAGLAVATVGFTANANTAFDGNWSVEVHAQTGSCDQSYRLPITVSHGSVNYSGRFPVTASGAVDPAGGLDIEFAHGSDVVAASGRLGSQWGRGEWRSATLDCTGTWLARRS